MTGTMIQRAGLWRPGFTRAAWLAGARDVAPLQIAFIPFGLICGVVAQGHGLSLLETALMSAFCFAGSAQLLALGQWAVPAPVIAVTLATLAVNMRLILMGPVLSSWLRQVRGWRLWVSLFVMADQNWAMSVKQQGEGRWDAGYLLGSGVVTWFVWLITTMAGHLLGSAVRLPAGHPIFFAALAVFVAMCVTLWRGRQDLLPWVVAAGVALLSARFLGGTWHIVLGALAGAAFGVARDRLRPGARPESGS